MPTREDLIRLGVRLRSVETMTPQDQAPIDSSQPFELHRRAVGVLLVGAGRIGVVHAHTLSRLQGTTLRGIVDTNQAASALLRGLLGRSVPAYTRLEDSLTNHPVDAAVIATPPSTHLQIARTCLHRQLHILIEKPLATNLSELQRYRQLADESPHQTIQVGYVLLRNPQVSFFLDQLRAGELGSVRGFVGVTLVSLIQHSRPQRWEVVKGISGGGALINSGSHVLSMIIAAFGDPLEVSAQFLHIHSSDVEDSTVTRFRYPLFEGTHYCSWSVQGYPRQENRLIIWTDRGQLILTGSLGVFVPYTGEYLLRHQLDFNVGFNLAPDYAGGGFSQELTDLATSVRTRRAPPVDLETAMRIETTLFKIYGVAQRVEVFDQKGPSVLPQWAERCASPAQSSVSVSCKLVLDLRDLSASFVQHYLFGRDQHQQSKWFQVTASHVAKISDSTLESHQLRVTVPNFLEQSRLLGTRQYTRILRQIGLQGILAAGRSAVPAMVRERGFTFWAAAIGLLAADLARIPYRFRGSLLLHSYLTDLALTLDRWDVLERMLHTMRGLRPHARVGFHSNLAADAWNTLPLLDLPVDHVSLLTSPDGLQLPEIMRSLRTMEHPPALTAEVGPAPLAVHRAALAAPHKWAHGAQELLLDAAVDPVVGVLVQREKTGAWGRAFPHLSLPDAVL